MSNTPFSPLPLLPHFVGRAKELDWLYRETRERGYRPSFSPIVVTGKPGIGKTALVRQFFASQASNMTASWFNAPEVGSTSIHEALSKFTHGLYEDRRNTNLSVVLDGADCLTHEQLIEAVARVFNFKAVRSLIVIMQRNPKLRGQRTLELERLSESEAKLLFSSELICADSSGELIARAIQIANGQPLLLSLIRGLAPDITPGELVRILEGHLYNLADLPSETEEAIIAAAKPAIVLANEAMIEALKKRPEDIFQLSPRKYEEMVTELLSDMGYDVELTPATRDGGKDILANLKTDIGDFLCLVEAKRYRKDRKIGVELVRSLYGTLCDYQANSAMMVTTSSFSKDAHEFQKKHRYQLSLRDYTDLARWIQDYRKPEKRDFASRQSAP